MNLGNKYSDGLLSPVGQIKEALKKEKLYTTVAGQVSLQNRTDTFRINQNNILINILNTAREYNKGKKQYLSKFINNYISKLSIDEDNELLSKLYYYLEVYEIEAPTSKKIKNVKLDSEILADTNNYSKTVIMSELLFNNVYLPEYTNQKLFNNDMIKLIKKVENRITKFRLGRNPVLFAPVSGGNILTYMDDVRTNTVKGVKYFDKGVIKNIGYKFALNERVDSGEENEFYFSININANDKNYFSREEYIRHIMEDKGKGSLMDGRDYYFGEDNLFRYSYYIGETFYKPSEGIDNDGMAIDSKILGFEMRIYAHPKKDFNPEENLDNVCLRLPGVVENIVTDIYETYGRDSNGNTSYPSKTEHFVVQNLLNSEEDKDGGISDLGSGLVAAMGGDLGEDRKNVLEKWDMFSKKQTKLLIDSKTEETIDVFIDQISHFEKYKKIGINKMPTGAMFFGPGGVGKSELCKKIGFETKGLTDFYYLNISELFNKYLGESEKNIGAFFEMLRSNFDETGKIQLLFIDEIDGLISNDSSEALSGIRSKLLSELSEGNNEGIIVLGTTNFPEKLNGPILRRFSEKVGITLPDNELRYKLFELNLSNYDNSFFDINLDIIKLVNKTSGMSHDFINQLIFNSVRYSVTLLNDGEKIDYNFIMRFFDRTKDIIDGKTKKMGFDPN